MKMYVSRPPPPSPGGSSNDYLFHSPASPDCDFEESMCNWDTEQGWVLEIRKEGFETSGKMLPVYAVSLSQKAFM